jgi:hypothetical protein
MAVQLPWMNEMLENIAKDGGSIATYERNAWNTVTANTVAVNSGVISANESDPENTLISSVMIVVYVSTNP